MKIGQKTMRRIKKLIKSIISFICGKNISKLNKVDLSAYDFISFDIFDTLIIRKCIKPEAIFDLVAEKFEDVTNKSIYNFYKEERIKAEMKARNQSINEEISFEEIFLFMNEFDENEIAILKRLEIEIELECCLVNSEMKRMYDKVSSLGKKVIITSDMYLNIEVISEILKNAGIVGYEHLFLSSELLATKKTGNLFEIIKKEYGNVKIFHIGDNPICDYIIPRKKGLCSFLYKK